MSFIQNFPFFSIVLSMFGGIISSVLNGKWAKRFCVFVISLVAAMSAVLLIFLYGTGESYTYMMGHYPAPWGNEIRAGVLEAVMALFFSIIMLLSILGGSKHTEKDVEPKKVNLYYLLINLLLSSLLALVYTNDMFTAYVFVEINTLSACGLIIIRQKGHAIVAGIRYMIMSLLGSGLFLIGICLLYDITGHLLMSNMRISVEAIMQNGTYAVPMQIIIGLICVGLAIKSALFPFHSWVPDTYGYSTCSSAAILSSLVSKGYIFLLIKFMYRVIGFETIQSSRILNILFVFGIIGMIAGSIGAIKEKDLRRMIAYSSVAQIGYIYMGLGIGSTAGVVAAIFHIFVHASTKSLLFVSSAGLTQVSGDSKKFTDLTGAGYRDKASGLAFAVGCLSMVGIPIFAGFMSKILFATAAIGSHQKIWITLLALAISTMLNAMYFLKTLLRIFTKADKNNIGDKSLADKSFRYVTCLIAFVALNIFIGLQSQPIIDTIQMGLSMFS
ncbi:MAG: proton-conducting transporter membrane subunit [Oscillospiraceae bacterium]